jgi:hypothetical protein
MTPGALFSTNERWAALRSTRRAQGLCIRCGAKWSRDHRCAKVTALDELLALFSPEDSIEEPIIEELPAQAKIQMLLSVAALSGESAPRTMKFDGQLGDTSIRILLDSGSTHTFISTSVASLSSDIQPLIPPVQVKVANGQVLTYDQYIPAAKWSIQGLEF